MGEHLQQFEYLELKLNQEMGDLKLTGFILLMNNAYMNEFYLPAAGVGLALFPV